MSEFHFLRPFWLLAFIPLALFSWQFHRLGREGGDWRRVCDAALLPYILIHDHGGQSARRASFWFGLGGVLAILALAGPVWERLPAPAFRNDAALVIALDLSRIMEAGDLKPSRLERARFKVADILKQRKDGLTALLVYSGDAFTVTPLTDDVGTITAQLSALTSDLMPAQGSRADLALERAGRLLKQAGLTRGDVLLITNGGSLGKGADAAKSLRSDGYRVSVLGAGNEEGAPVPLPEGGFLQDTQGNIIISKLAAPALRRLAEEGGGIYRKLGADNADVQALQGFFSQQAQKGTAEGEAKNGATIEQWEERGPWLLLLLLPIAALAFRRGVLAVLVLLALPLPRPAQALEWQELWQTRDQRASQALQAGDAAKAAETFDNPAWKAAAQYKAGQFDEAAETLQGQETSDAHYNRGNALAKAGDLPGAVVAYDKALKLDPNNEDARHNKDLVEKELEKQQQEQKQKDKKQGQDGQDKQDKQDKGQGKQGQQEQQDQNGQKEGKDQGEPKEGQNQQQGQERQPSEQGQDQQGEKQQGQSGQSNKTEGQQGQEQPAGQAGQQEQEKQGKEVKGQREADKPEQGEPGKAAGVDGRKSEEQQANEQWLRRIPDDPGGLLRRKFLYQYQQRQGGAR